MREKGFTPIAVLISVVIVVVLVAVGFYFYLSYRQTDSLDRLITPPPKGATQSSQKDETANWKFYSDSKYRISFKYPPSWSINQATQLFEDGDLVAVQFTGATQQEQTEFYDGARFVVMIPQSTNLDLDSWVNSKHSSNVSGIPPQISDTEINGMSFKKVYECGLGCFTYYYTVIRGQVYGISVFADGPQKVELEATINQMLKTLVLPQ